MSRYEILERIGLGGMAEVFRGVAISEAGFRKPVAIKKILPHLGRDHRFVQMLIAEAKMLASLRQRSIVQIYDLGQDEEEQYFLVMEYVDGMDLADLQEFLEERGEKLDASIALHIGAEIADALDHAHTSKAAPGGKGVIHRDVSPANVLLAYSGEVKLTDFGIAKHGDQSIIASLKGKFAYMSPEQARAMPVDGATDQFSLGLVLYELMTGRRVFSHLGDLDALRLAREGTIPPPTVADPEFPREVEPILMKTLDPDPRRRYPSSGELAKALRKVRGTLRAKDEPSVALSALLRRFGIPREGSAKERAAIDKKHSLVKLSTAFLFDDMDLGKTGGSEPIATDESTESAEATDATLPGTRPLTDPDGDATTIGPPPTRPSSTAGAEDAATTIGPPPTAPAGKTTSPSFHEAPTVAQVVDDDTDGDGEGDGEDDLRKTSMRPSPITSAPKPAPAPKPASASAGATVVPPGSAYPGFAPPKLQPPRVELPGGRPMGKPSADLVGSTADPAEPDTGKMRPLPGLPPPPVDPTGSWTPPPGLANAELAASLRFPVGTLPPISLKKAGIVIAAIVVAVVIFAAIVAEDPRPSVTSPADEAIEIATPDAAVAPPDAPPRKKKKPRRAR